MRASAICSTRTKQMKFTSVLGALHSYYRRIRYWKANIHILTLLFAAHSHTFQILHGCVGAWMNRNAVA